jgi:predicted lipoprotein with Yx(FWY)xxD motif
MNASKAQKLWGLNTGLVAAAGLALVAASCGSSTTRSSTHTGSSATPPAASSGSAGSGAYTVSAQPVGSAGTVLVNGQGRTLYLLSSEKGGKITCTDANGCTKIWPPVELPDGVTKPVAGSGIDSSLLSTVRTSTGDLYVTYGGWPLYTFSGDSASGTANGVGINSFGGTWSAVSTTGNPAGSTGAAPTTTTGGSGGGGYGGGGY